jgi:glyoxylase-like metal-dependent hydrolase (beta-lactamase superfamily II)
MRAFGVRGTTEEGQILEVAPDVLRVPTGIVNTYLVGDSTRWVLVDTGWPGLGSFIRRAARERFGAESKPAAIILTHGHFDHSGNVDYLLQHWDVPVYAHALELSYLAGRSQYPPQDPTVGGAMAFLSRAFPTGGHRPIASRVQPLANELTFMPGWRWIHTPGHTPGHVSLFRDADGLLLAGDAVVTMNVDSWIEQVRRTPELCKPPTPLTPDWEAAEDSVRQIAMLSPRALAAGHGVPVAGDGLAQAMRRFAAMFTPPPHGRYVAAPAAMGSAGLEWVPPPVPDVFARHAAGAALMVLGGLGLAAAGRRGRRS